MVTSKIALVTCRTKLTTYRIIRGVDKCQDNNRYLQDKIDQLLSNIGDLPTSILLDSTHYMAILMCVYKAKLGSAGCKGTEVK